MIQGILSRRLSPAAVVAAALATGVVAPLGAGGEPADSGVAGAASVSSASDGAGPFDRVTLVRELMRRRGGDPAAAAQLVQMTREFEAAVAADMFEVLAAAHLAAGQVDLAADARLLLVQTHPDAPAARRAALWLTRLYASGEVAHMHSTADGEQADATRGMAMYAYSLGTGFEAAAKTRAEQLGQAAPADDPALRFARAAAARRAGQAKPAAALLTPLKHARPGDPWGDCAKMEDWLAKTREAAAPPKPVAHCPAANAPPKLDGVLAEACWQADAGVVLEPPQTEAIRRVCFAFDREFLYVACELSHAPGVDYSLDRRPRTRDADLSQHDRVTILLDADRDYATAWELAIDSRGWTGDRCWGDATWNPEWFVAAAPRAENSLNPADAYWVVEAAIPWSALARKAPHSGEAWACGVVRETPGAAAEGWPVAGGAGDSPTRFGVLVFE
jgi:hypothetical protein